MTAGATLGLYEILSALGAGGMGSGAIRLFLDSLFARANKCLNLGAQRENFLARWVAEVPVVARLPLLKRTG